MNYIVLVFDLIIVILIILEGSCSNDNITMKKKSIIK